MHWDNRADPTCPSVCVFFNFNRRMRISKLQLTRNPTKAT